MTGRPRERLPRVDREGHTGPTNDLESPQVGSERIAGLVSRKIECHGEILGVERGAQLRRLDALGLGVVAECAKDDRAAEPVPLPGASLIENDLARITGGQVAPCVQQRSEPRLGMQRIVGRQLGAQISHAGPQALLGLQQSHAAARRRQERRERIQAARADELSPVGIGIDGGVQRRHRLERHADVHVQMQLDRAAESHVAPLPVTCRTISDPAPSELGNDLLHGVPVARRGNDAQPLLEVRIRQGHRLDAIGTRLRVPTLMPRGITR